MAQLVWRYLIIEWGAGLLFIGLGGLAALYLVLCIIRRKGSHHELVALSFYGIGLGLAIVMLAFGLIVSDPIRMNQVTLFASILLIGATLARLSQNTTGLQRYLHALGRYALVIALVVAAIGAPFTVYNESKHVRETEMAGAEHLIRFRNPDKHTLAMAMSRQLGVFVMGTHRAPPFPNWVFSREKEGYQLPSRLGYETNSSVSALFEKSGYIVTKERDRKWIQNQPPNRWPGVSYLTAGDLRRLNNDLAADHVYSNGRYSTWLVHKPMQNMTQ